MTDPREDLIQLLSFFADGYSVENRYIVDGTKVCEIVDHLMANGVTVQKWIPVAERLPEKSGYYLIWQNGWDDTRETYIGWYKEVSRKWEIADSDWHYPCDKVTHWLPLPPAPEVTK